MSQSQTIGISEAYRIARGKGYVKDQPISYVTMISIVSEAYEKGINAAEARQKDKTAE